MFAKDDEIEGTSVLVKVDGRWTFQLVLDDGTIIRCDQSWSTQEEAKKMLNGFIEHAGWRSTPIQ